MRKITYTAMALAVGGCVIGSGTIYHIDDPYLFFGYQAAKGGIPVVIVGDPYPGRRAQVESTVVAALQQNFPSQRNFHLVAAAPGEGTKVVFMFDPPGSAQTFMVCRDPSTAAAASGSGAPRMNAGAVYCGAGPYSEAWLTFDRPAAPDSPEFRKMMAQLVNDAIPRRRSPGRESDSILPPPS